ncbi:signal peptidase II [Rhodococcus chondri]|uniref:Lipoprotein signal peptidase n=1 Tax=Rhodococcus chondri TaxID=3065941 RepID=A0ABU7JTZ3_9NOCA|nr:signal peptidase II [Rhodococcus sp. CC-R104]MEE2033496.1 signal peptidase II [Rhodococcus sp. CC-R104]
MTDDASQSDRAPDPAAQVPVATAVNSPAGRRLRSLLAVAFLIYVFDLATKIVAVHFIDPADPISLIGDTVTLTLVRNPGAAFSMATGMTWLLTLVAIGVVIGVIKIGRTLRSKWWALGLGLVLGGALGNLTDRLFRSPGPLQGHVVDFVSVGWWPVFNVADSAIVCGAILLVALTVFGIEPDGTVHRAGKNGAGMDTTAKSTTAKTTTAENTGKESRQ